ncbi:MAG: glucosamine-6-phosphate deaminase [Synechococcaceae cyanobacterium]
MQVFRDPSALARAVANQLLEQRLRRPQRPLGLATGRTMEPIYAALISCIAAMAEPERRRLRHQWLSFNLDDYVGLAPDDPRSFRSTMRQQLQEPLGLATASLRLPCADAEDPDREAHRYGEELRAAGGQDLQLLGLGLNGHVGFNEPPCSADAGCRCVRLSQSTRMANAADFGGDPEAVPERAITLGLREILRASRILLVVTGAKKADILNRLLLEAPSPGLPASWLRGHGCVGLIVDEQALTGSSLR